MKTKCYPHVIGLYGDNGENRSALSVHAVLDPSPNYPEAGRIIVGSPGTTPTIPGYIANLGGFNGGPDAIERLAATLTEAVRDVRAALGIKRDETIDLDATELDAAETLIGTLDRLNERAAVDPDALRVARLMQRMASEIRRRHASSKRIRELVPDIDSVFDEVERARPIVKAAVAFVDEQGKRVEVDRGYTIGLPEDFASVAFEALVKAVTEAGR